MAASPPPPDDEDPAAEEELFALFRHLRERVFVGSSEIVSHVMRGIEAQLQTAPRESFAATILVQLTNWVTSWFEPAGDGKDEDRPARKPFDARGQDTRDDALEPGDDDD